MKEDQRINYRRPRRLPDKWLAVALFLLLLAIYLWRHDDTIKQMMFTAFGLLCVAISDGLRRVADYSKARLNARGDRQRREETQQDRFG